MSQYNRKKAVALQYDENQQAAPIIVASGQGYVAEKIIETAVAHDVPVFEDSSLTTVLSQLELGAEIPEEVYQAVVDIYVYFLNYLPGKKQSEDQIDTSDHSESV